MLIENSTFFINEYGFYLKSGKIVNLVKACKTTGDIIIDFLGSPELLPPSIRPNLEHSLTQSGSLTKQQLLRVKVRATEGLGTVLLCLHSLLIGRDRNF